MALALAGCLCAPAYGDGSLVDQRLEEAYLAVRGVSESHGEADNLVELINEAIDEMEAGADPGLVVAQLDAVIALAVEETARGAAARDALLLVTAAQVAAAGALAYTTWRYFPRLFWGWWLKLRGGWAVEHAGR